MLCSTQTKRFYSIKLDWCKITQFSSTFTNSLQVSTLVTSLKWTLLWSQRALVERKQTITETTTAVHPIAIPHAQIPSAITMPDTTTIPADTGDPTLAAITGVATAPNYVDPSAMTRTTAPTATRTTTGSARTDITEPQHIPIPIAVMITVHGVHPIIMIEQIAIGTITMTQ